MMYSYIAAAALAGSVSASVLPRTDGCCFQLTASGGESGSIGQLGDGQNRIGGGYTPATYCISNGEITDSSGRGCILTPPTTQFQCDVGANPTSGFSISGSGEVEFNGSGTFYACGASSSEYNLYTKPVADQKDCHEVKLSSGGKCAGNGGAGGSSSASVPKGSTASTPASMPPAYSSAKSMPAPSMPAMSMPAESKPASSPAYSMPASSMPAESKPVQSKPATSMPAPSKPAESKPVESMPAYSKPSESKPAPSMPAYSKPAESKPVESMPAPSMPAASMPAPSMPAPSMPAPSMPAMQPPVSAPACPPAATVTVTVTQACPSGAPPASSPKAPASSPMAPVSSPMAPVSSPMAPVSSPMAPESSPKAPVSKSAAPPAGTPASPTAAGSACQTSLTGAYQTPHLIVPITSDKPDVPHGTSYFGAVNSTTSTIFNFDVPADYAGKQCSIVFLFPQKKDLTTSDYTFSGSGSLGCSELSSVASQSTSWSNAPSVAKDLGDVAIQPGNSYVVATGACKAGTTHSIELSSKGGLSLSFFEDWNPSPLGLFMTSC